MNCGTSYVMCVSLLETNEAFLHCRSSRILARTRLPSPRAFSSDGRRAGMRVLIISSHCLRFHEKPVQPSFIAGPGGTILFFSRSKRAFPGATHCVHAIQSLKKIVLSRLSHSQPLTT